MTNIRLDKEGRYEPSSAVQLDLKQFERLREIDPPLTCAQIAHRMAWTKLQTRKLLRKYKDHRP
jgi:hypothetical protein